MTVDTAGMRVDCLWQHASTTPDAVAVRQDDQVLTASAVVEHAKAVARRLQADGARVNDVLVLSGLSRLDALLVSLGALRSGVHVLAIPAVAQVGHFRAVLDRLHPEMFVAGSGSLPHAAEGLAAQRGCRVRSPQALLAPSEQDVVPARPLPDVSGWILPGARPPARPPLGSHRAMGEALASSFFVRYDLPQHGRHLCAVPFWNSAPLSIALGALHSGHELLLPTEEDADYLVAKARQWRATSMFVVPSALQGFTLALPAEPELALESVIAGVAPCPPTLRVDTESKLGPVLYEWYIDDGLHRLRPPAPSALHSRLGFWHLAEYRPGEVVVTEAGGATVTRGDLLNRARRLVSAWSRRGLEPGAVVASLLGNSADAVAVYLAAAEGGYAYLPLPEDAGPERLRGILEACRPSLIVSVPTRPLPTPHAAVSIAALFSEGTHAPPAPRQCGTLVALTSGSTGLPKVITHDPAPVDIHYRAVADAAVARYFGFPPSGPHLVTTSLSSGACLTVAMAALQNGQSLVLMERWLPGQALNLIERHRIASAFFVPTMMAALLREREGGRTSDTSSLESVVHGGAPCPESVKRGMLKWLGPILHEFYASAEVPGTYALASDWLEHPGTVGRPFPGVSLRVVDQDGVPVAAGETGAISLFGGGFSARTAADAETTLGYAEIGDFGFLDGDGLLRLVGRDSEIIKVAGVKVHAREVEEVIQRNPLVADAAVIGRPHPSLGECVVAYVELVEAAASNAVRSVLRNARDSLPVTKAPRRVIVVETLPRTGTGKVDRNVLLAWDTGLTSGRSVPGLVAAP